MSNKGELDNVEYNQVIICVFFSELESFQGIMIRSWFPLLYYFTGISLLNQHERKVSKTTSITDHPPPPPVQMCHSLGLTIQEYLNIKTEILKVSHITCISLYITSSSSPRYLV